MSLSRPRVTGHIIGTASAYALRLRVGIAFLLLLAISAGVFAYPKPSPIPFRWELDFEPGDLRLYLDPLSGEGYWYMPYTVINETGQDRIWAPNFTLFGDDGNIVSSGDEVPTRITDDIRRLLADDLIETQAQIIGDILQGEENALSGLVIWKAPSLEANEISIFVAGLSGESQRVTNPVTKEPMVLRKTLQRDYLVPGSPAGRGSAPAELVEERWVMR